MAVVTDTPALMMHLPNTMASWPGTRKINPHYEEVNAQSNLWFRTFKALNPQSQYAFDKGEFTLLAALTYPWVSKDYLRIGSDLMYVLFLIDEYTDVEPAHVVRKIVNIIHDTMNDPHKERPNDESVIGEITRQFWERAIELAGPACRRHMRVSLERYLESIVVQAADRDGHRCLTIKEYLQRRLENGAVRLSFFPLELGLNLPDDAFYHPSVVEITNLVIEIVCIDNDIASYNKEQAVGDDQYNILTVAMRQFNISLNDATHWAAKHHGEVEAKFHKALLRVPSFGTEVDRQLQQYICGISQWPRGNDCWNFEDGRYYGDKGLEYRQTRLVPVLPKAPKYIEYGLHGKDIVVPFVAQLEGEVRVS